MAAGQAFRLLRDSLGDAELTEIRRQRSQEDIARAELFYRHAGNRRGETAREDQAALGADILAAWEAREQLERTDTREEAIERLLNDYLASPLGHEEKLIMAGTHADTGALNQSMRARLVERGEVGSEGHAVALKQGRRRIERTLAPGDRLRFGKLDEDFGVMNGSTSVVESIRMTAKGSAVLGVRLNDSGRLVRLDTATYGHLDYAHACTLDHAQGATVVQAYFLASAQRVYVRLGLVAATRHRDGFKVYATEADLEVFQERLETDRLRVNALEEGHLIKAPAGMFKVMS